MSAETFITIIVKSPKERKEFYVNGNSDIGEVTIAIVAIS